MVKIEIRPTKPMIAIKTVKIQANHEEL
jgi:hypothetical protein